MAAAALRIGLNKFIELVAHEDGAVRADLVNPLRKRLGRRSADVETGEVVEASVAGAEKQAKRGLPADRTLHVGADVGKDPHLVQLVAVPIDVDRIPLFDTAPCAVRRKVHLE